MNYAYGSRVQFPMVAVCGIASLAVAFGLGGWWEDVGSDRLKVCCT